MIGIEVLEKWKDTIDDVLAIHAGEYIVDLVEVSEHMGKVIESSKKTLREEWVILLTGTKMAGISKPDLYSIVKTAIEHLEQHTNDLEIERVMLEWLKPTDKTSE